MKRLAVLWLCVACGAGSDQGAQPDGGQSSDAAGGCSVAIGYDPAMPVAGDTIRATAIVTGLFAVPTYAWTLSRESDGSAITFTDAQPDHSAIAFTADLADTYDVTLSVTGGADFCPPAVDQLNVLAPGANVVGYRLRVASPFAPPQEQTMQVHGGAGNYAFGAFVLSPGVTATGTLKSGAVPVPAYLRFIPTSHPDEIVEAFAGADGSFTAQLVDELHHVLVIPAIAGSAPAMLTWQTGQATLAITAGTAISGVVKDPAGAVLANAKVQLTIAGVPSTIGTTAPNGTFTVRGNFATGDAVTVDVTPPPATGLPSLTASASTFDLTQSVQVRYASTLVIRNLAGTIVQRSGGLANASVNLVGSLAGTGTVVAGTTVSATSIVRATATTTATGALPALLAPNGPLSAVIAATPSDLTVVAVDLSTAVPATITAPAPIHATGGVAALPQGSLLGGESIEAAPTGALALAGATSVFATSAADGTYTIQLASGGHYQLRFSHPAGLAGPLVIADVSGSVPSTASLPPPIAISGSVSITGNPAPVAGAAIQMLCRDCVGIERSRPVASAATDQTGAFLITVADPGTM